LLCVQWKTPDDGQRNCPKHVEFYSKNKFEKLVHLVGFIIRICHDARSPEQRHSILYSVNAVTTDLSPSSERQLSCVAGQSLVEAGYSAWGFMEPTNFEGEDCGGMNNLAQLVDITCTYKYPFVCEYEV